MFPLILLQLFHLRRIARCYHVNVVHGVNISTCVSCGGCFVSSCVCLCFCSTRRKNLLREDATTCEQPGAIVLNERGRTSQRMNARRRSAGAESKKGTDQSEVRIDRQRQVEEDQKAKTE